jgi:hypothetical protein
MEPQFPLSAAELQLPGIYVFIAPTAGQRVFRLVRSAPSSVGDFLSAQQKGRPRHRNETYVEHLGLSVWDELDKALAVARRYPKIVAEIELRSGLGLGLASTSGPGHFTVWGEPEMLRDCATVVYREDEQ